jgi:glutathione reductase (NADPH)
VAIVGAGYIAVELACVLNGLGADVTIFCRKETVLRNFDESIHTTLRDQMEKNGIFFQPNSNLQRVIKSQKNTKTIVLENGMEHHGFDCVLYAAGRVPMTDDLNLKQAGIEMDSHGYIKVDEYQKTNVENIFAVGDVCADGIALTPVAIAAGRRLSDRLFGNQPQAKISYENIPTVVFSHPTIGTIGLTEEQARQKYSEKEIKIYTSRFVNMYFGLHNEMPMEKSCQQHQQKSSKPSTIIKLICVGKKEKIVGLHIIGMAADEMLQGFGVAIKMGATKADFDSCIAIHPTAAEEVVTMAPWGLCGTH